MARVVHELMSEPITVTAQDTVTDAANLMRQRDVGYLVVIDGARPVGVLTDRDIVVRVVAIGMAPQNVLASELCSGHLTTVGPQDDTTIAVARMRENSVRRLPVVADDRLVGVISLGDVMLDRGGDSVLRDITAARPNL
jgi:CBS domain-containing protein